MKKVMIFGCGPRHGSIGRFYFCLVMFACLGLCSVASAASEPDPSGNPAKPPLAAGTNKNTTSVSDSMAGEMEVAALGNALTNRMQEVVNRTSAMESVVKRHQWTLTFLAVLLVMFVALVRFGRRLLAPFAEEKKPQPALPTLATAAAADLSGEEKAFADFAASFKIGPKSANTVSPSPAASAKPSAAKSGASAAAPQSPAEFLRSAPNRVARCRVLLRQTGRVKGEQQMDLIKDLNKEIQALKSDASHPDLTPFWQVTSSVEGLIKHLLEKPANVTSSTLRTIAGCVDLLDRLAAAGVNPDLLKTPPVRFLAVDDDPISRHTISFALKRALNAPDVAPNGTEGLALAEQSSYDAIFLDIQMPGMDGFELCKKIRAGGRNQSSPIVFVTCQSDFNSRAQSSLAGGCDLIGKPFLTFEVTAKALLLAIGNRLGKLEPAQAQVA